VPGVRRRRAVSIEDAKQRLIAAALRDRDVRARLAKSGALFDGYNAEMEAVHLENAAMLETIIAELGWPDHKRFGDDGAGAAFMIAQHAISRPDFQRAWLGLLVDAVARGDANPLDAAYLADRIAVFEGRAQRFGTQFDWDEDGRMSPAPILEPEGVDQRRAEIGLPPLADAVAEMRANAARESAPADHAHRHAEFLVWARKVGWRA